MSADNLFTADFLTDEETGAYYGVTHDQLTQAVKVWSYAQDKPVTVGDAALAFNVTPKFLAYCIHSTEDEYFFIAGDNSNIPAMTLEHDAG